ncbi:stage IV sporulation protein A [Edaphobacillus lindanitolerans]|uniref:Stage IV sporulation protein A n=1 Tax=Edaphobacillus lindanitolerans TaxID=550447 RepID=A0A1U7PKM7_9BACI|nr:stage IV sporulation protein A [Edaphobacillus lindanitolerans]SIT66497.1 stage IV sporulation protein A [Edaphobacillus lindanitolerans]
MSEALYEELAKRTDGDIYIGVVGPVRVGKSTFVKRVMEEVVIPNMVEEADRTRAQDELPQSSPGPVIMTAEPKFVPARGTGISVGDGGLTFQIRLADCVGYVIDGVKGHMDDDGPKFVHTPWHNEPVPFEEAARIGTDKVIRDHSTIGVVMTTDGSVNNIPRASALRAEEEIVGKLKEIGKPFVIVLNSRMPAHTDTVALKEELSEKYSVPVIAISADQLNASEIQLILKEALFEFPISEIELLKPEWMDVLDEDHALNASIRTRLDEGLSSISKIRDVQALAASLQEEPFIKRAEVTDVDAGQGKATIRVETEDDVYHSVCDEMMGEPIRTKKDWLLFIKDSVKSREAFGRYEDAIESAKTTGYGVTLPGIHDFEPTPPELIKQNNFFGVRMKAKAPSLHIMRIDMEAEFSPLIGSEFHSLQLLKDLKEAYLNDREALWSTQLFGTPLHEVMKESIRFKTTAVPERARNRIRETMEQMVNDGNKGMVTFIL